MITGLLIAGSGIPPALGLEPTLMVFTPVPGMLKLIVSSGPKVPGFWAMMSGSPRLLPALIAVIASRSETLPSFGVISSEVVVTVMTASSAGGAETALGLSQ